MYLKLMAQGVGRNGSNPYELLEIASVKFGHVEEAGSAPLSYADVLLIGAPAVERREVKGTAYVLNAAGDTIDQFTELAVTRTRIHQEGRKG